MARVHLPKVIGVTLLSVPLVLGLVTRGSAQSDEVLVTITRIESNAFPQVTASVVVSDENGPLDDLTAANFAILEDGNQVPAEAISVVGDASQGVHLVLALDLSVPADELAQLKAASLAFLDSLEPSDVVALLSFHNQVEEVQDFTTDRQALKAGIENLTGQGDRTAFNEAALVAVDMLGKFPASRKVVVLLTNSRNNIGDRSLEEVIEKARTGGISVYVAGYDKIDRDPLEKITMQTGGRFFKLSGPAQAEASLQTVEALLRHGSYQVTFQSGLKADNQQHDLDIKVTYQGKGGQATGYFTAVPGQVNVDLPMLEEGQTVVGSVDLRVQATAPAPIESVTYLLNDQSLIVMLESPYRYPWDTTTQAPGRYRLTAIVKDGAGNEGRAEVNLEVSLPVEVTVEPPQREILLGQMVPFTVSVVSRLDELAKIEILVDGEVVDTCEAAPDATSYQCTLDSGAYDPGAQLITFRAVDKGGRLGEDSVQVQFVAPPPLEPIWPRILAVAGTLAVAWGILTLSFFGLVYVLGVIKRWPQQVFRLQLSNLGNIDSYYTLRAEDAGGDLDFRFTWRGAELPLWPPPAAGPEPGGDGAFATPPAPAGAAQPASGVVHTAGGAMRTGGGVAGGLAAAGRILPGSAGASVQRVASPLYRTQSTVRSATTRVRSRSSQLTRFGSQVRGVAPSPATARSTAPPSPGPAPVGPVDPAAGEAWYETPLLAPGETLPVDLRIIPLHPYRTRRYAFQVLSQDMDAADAPLIMIEGGEVGIRAVPWYLRLLPYLVFIVLVVFVVLIVVGVLAYVI